MASAEISRPAQKFHGKALTIVMGVGHPSLFDSAADRVLVRRNITVSVVLDAFPALTLAMSTFNVVFATSTSCVGIRNA